MIVPTNRLVLHVVVRRASISQIPGYIPGLAVQTQSVETIVLYYCVGLRNEALVVLAFATEVNEDLQGNTAEF